MKRTLPKEEYFKGEAERRGSFKTVFLEAETHCAMQRPTVAFDRLKNVNFIEYKYPKLGYKDVSFKFSYQNNNF